MRNGAARLSVRLSLVGVVAASSLMLNGVMPAGQIDAQTVAANEALWRDGTRQLTLHFDHTPLLDALQTVAREAGLTPMYDATVLPTQKVVTLELRAVRPDSAFQAVLRGTGFVATIHQTGYVSLRRGTPVAADGRVTGTVTDAKTGQPLAGVSVLIDDAQRGVVTGGDGTFRFSHVAAGAHRLTARMIGRGKQVKKITVTEGEETVLTFALDTRTTTLDQVVVTGTVVPTEQRAVPNAMTVITAKELEERGITHIDQLFRGDVPGLFVQNSGSNNPLNATVMYSRGASNLRFDNSNNFGTNPIKTYVDGVELADARYLSQIDPKSIERIEILTGPQASTIYGSNAINGVMQIFTKRGATNRPQVTLALLSGTLQNNFGTAIAPQHDYSAQVSGVEGRWSYNAGTSWQYIGHWSPAIQQRTLGGVVGGRFQAGPVSTDLSGRLSMVANQQHGNSAQTYAEYAQDGYYTSTGGQSLSRPTEASSNARTLGLTVGYAPFSWWSHELVLGNDVSNVDSRGTGIIYQYVGDSTLSLTQGTTELTSIRYATTARVGIAPQAQLTMTLGGDGWKSLATSTSAGGTSLTGPLNFATVTRQPGHNTGAFFQGQLGIADALFLTYGLRAEWNPNYGADVLPNYAPRYGATLARDIATPWGIMTAKIRGSYGRATKPPETGLKAPAADTYQPTLAAFGPHDNRLGNPDLTPELQQGGEGGLELYFGSLASLTVTHYNQTVSNLILDVYPVDSVRSLLPVNQLTLPSWYYTSIDAQGYGYLGQDQNLNVADLRNQGWELRGTTTIGPITANGTYSWTKSRMIGVTQRYRSLFPPIYMALQPGASFGGVPEHTWAFGVTYSRAATTVALNVTGLGQIPVDFDGSPLYPLLLNPSIRLQGDRAAVSSGWYTYRFSNTAGYALADVNAAHRFTGTVEGLLQVQNLANSYRHERDPLNATLGRQTKAGVRLRW